MKPLEQELPYYGVWITELDGSRGSWLLNDGDSRPWYGSFQEAVMLANRMLPWPQLHYTVKIYASSLSLDHVTTSPESISKP